MLGVHRVVIGCRRGEAVQANVANELAAMIDVWSTSRDYRAPHVANKSVAIIDV